MVQRRFPADYHVEQDIYLPAEARQDWAYNDGDSIETRIQTIVENSVDLSCLSSELRHQITDWASLYHLTPKRSNLLRPIKHQIKGRVLEVGAGCGAITRFLGETGAEIYSIEGSPRRASVCRSRTRDLPNVTVIADNVQNVAFDFKFDVITLIGVLEYARVFSDAADPIGELLVFLRSMLADDGILVIAIENQLGLKYFAGAVEDHMQQPFFGIHDRYSGSSVVTFGKNHLTNTLHDAGFPELQWLFPFPDYKLPITVLTEDAIKGELGVNLTGMFRNSNAADPQGAKPGGFSLDCAWPVIARNGLAADLANSFLVICSVSPPAKPDAGEPEIFAWHYATDRHVSFAKELVVMGDADTGFFFKGALIGDTAQPDLSFTIDLKDELLVKGASWLDELSRILNEPGWSAEQVADWLKVWVQAVLRRDGQSDDLPIASTSVSGRMLDALPFNMMVDDRGNCRFFDLEFVAHEALPLDYLAFRALKESLDRVTSVEAPRKLKHISTLLLVTDVAREIGLSLTIAKIRALEQMNRRFISGVRFGEEAAAKPGSDFFLSWRMKVRSRQGERLPIRVAKRARRLLARA